VTGGCEKGRRVTATVCASTVYAWQCPVELLVEQAVRGDVGEHDVGPGAFCMA